METYYRAQGLFCAPDSPAPEYSATLDLDLGTVEPSLAGPKRPQDRIPLARIVITSYSIHYTKLYEVK